MKTGELETSRPIMAANLFVLEDTITVASLSIVD